MSSRPVYIPPAKRKSGNNSKPQRFHGAFTGGFSAGYFNTVNTKEGWKPSNQKRKDQRLEDFMDEQDHEEWGGPTKVRQDYQTIAEENTSNLKPGLPNQAESLDTLLRISHESVGPRLLRKLGWSEEGKAAIVPMQDGETTDTKGEEDREANILLSSKRLKKIRLQTNRFEIPPPKLDECGLGFEPHLDAPEFKAFRERRKARAKERQTAAGSSNVYRASTLTKDSAENGLSGGKDDNDGDDYLNYAETAEDFIGKKSVGGFAFRDDEDDAYDNTNDGRGAKPSREMLGDEYNMEIYEHQDSDNEEAAGTVTFDPSREQLNDRGLIQRKTDLGSVLSSWANTSNTATKGTALMSNGKPPLEGFALGGSINTHKKRYPGPDIPRDYIIKRHVFGENEHPLIFQTIARAVKLQEKEQHLQRMNRKSLLPLGGGSNFSNLADAMKSRFTSSKSEEKTTTERVGLYKPDPLVAKRRNVEEAAAPTKVPTVKKPIVLKRTIESFLPHPLLCKRFGVPVPKNAIGISMNASTMSSNQPSRVTEANYFEQEIMSVRESEKLAKKEDIEKKRSSGAKTKPDLDMEQDPVGLQRPSMEKLKSIFAADSDSESSTDLDASSGDEDEEKEEEPKEEILQRAKDIVANAMGSVKPSSEPANNHPKRKEGDDDNKSMSSSADSSTDSRHRERRRKRKSRRKKHSSTKRRKRLGSPNNDDDDDSGDEDDRRRRKERRRKHDRKHRKKKSSRRKRDREH